MNQKERKRADTISNMAAIAVDANKRASLGKLEAEKAANRRLNYFMGFVLIIVSLFIYHQNRKADERDERDLLQTKLMLKKAQLDKEQNEKLLDREIWAMSTHYQASLGKRFTWEYGEKAFAANGLKMPPPDKLPPLPVVTFWTDAHYDIFCKIIDENPDLACDEKGLSEAYKKELKRLEGLSETEAIDLDGLEN